MFDAKWIRDNPETFDRGLARRGLEPLSDKVVEIDEERRAHIQKLQDAQARRNAASKEIGAAMGKGDKDLAEKLKAEVAELKTFIQTGEDEERRFDGELRELLSGIPNLPLDETPDGED